MNLQSFICGASCRRLVLIVVFARLVYQAVAEDAQYEACVPLNCGYGANISYPFWISGKQESYCGYPNFQITSKIHTLAYFLGHEFIIKEISYTNHSILLVDALVYHDTCGAPPRNINLESTPLILSSTNADFFFYYNCTSPPPDFTYLVDCASNSTHHSFAYFPEEVSQEIYLYYAVSTCDYAISVPVYTAFNCSDCEGSEGWCGFENDDFVCFCQDGPHPQSCNDGKWMGEFFFLFLLLD
ncbi:hypothetical protein ACJRO7_009970 [Eucalyptus globulus]|uniref:Wall-associated receptor kinase galacturonan-binding domain-containing protein n=1 Tax=Eucalyptus globulus TaxID=34317 RepID=A0ABD3LAJ9_EUCGL